MKTTFAALIAVLLLHQALGFSIEDIVISKRELKAPAPIDCQMKPWTNWGPCDPCSKNMHRSRGIESFGQFGGQKCIDPIGDKKLCRPTTECEMDPPPVCKPTEFQCASELCIKKRLMCNGDNDCLDFSDEDECEKIRPVCGGQAVSESDIALGAGYGINILGSGPRMNPFDNKVYNGMCERVKEPKTLSYNRLPWNVAVLHYESLVEETSSKEVYKDTYEIIKEVTQDITSKTSVGLSFKFSPTESSSLPTSNGSSLASLSGGVKVATEKGQMIKHITEYRNTTEKSFFRVKGKVQLGTYRLRSRDLKVSENFLDSVDALPIEYEKSQYYGFLEDYGTHFTKNGKAGGEYELVYVLNKKTMENKKITETTLKDCLKIGIEASIDFTGGFSGGLTPGETVPHDKCTTVTTKEDGTTKSEPLIDKVISAVKGGSTESAAAMKSQLSKDGILDANKYVDWARTLQDLPALIQSDPEPIYNAIPLDFKNAQERKENLEQALQEYMAEYSVCKCQPCMNGGTVAQMDGECVCLCPLHYEGIACQTVRHDLMKDKNVPVQQKGNWGCWSAWSSCNQARRIRTRVCNTGAMSGATCLGDTINEDYC